MCVVNWRVGKNVVIESDSLHETYIVNNLHLDVIFPLIISLTFKYRINYLDRYCTYQYNWYWKPLQIEGLLKHITIVITRITLGKNNTLEQKQRVTL